MEDLMTPETPREFALIERIKVLERALARNGHMNHYISDKDGAVIQMPPGHPELLRVATVQATNFLGKWTVTAQARTDEPGKYYEVTQYIERPEDNGFRTSSVLAMLHRDFIETLGSDLTRQYGDVWYKFGR